MRVSNYEADKTYSEAFSDAIDEADDHQDIDEMEFYECVEDTPDGEVWREISYSRLKQAPTPNDIRFRVYSNSYIYQGAANDWGAIHVVYFERHPKRLKRNS